MEAIGIIPARYHSTRFEGKLLSDLCGKPVIQYTWENARKSRSIGELIIATDDTRIYNLAKGFGAKVIYTSKAHKSGTDRITEVVANIDTKVVVNIQADEPFINPVMIDDVVTPILKDRAIYMTSLCHKIKSKKELLDPNVVKVVMDRQGFALYFSRSPIPYLGDSKFHTSTYHRHIGLYAYTKDFLFTFKGLHQSRLEKMERLEQLRVIENSYRIKLIQTEFETIGIDTPEDLQKASEFIKGLKQMTLF